MILQTISMGVSSLYKKVKQKFTRKPYFASDDVEIGLNVRFGKNIIFNCKRVRIGDGTVFHDNITVNADIFEIGDYGTVYSHCYFPGPGRLTIGHNFWLGMASIIDCQGGTVIGNNVGIGAQSQLWTHIQYGDVLYGCRFNGAKPLEIENDVWLVGHCLVSPVKIGTRSMAMLGSVITKDMEADHTYAGVPARDVTEKLGAQFAITSVDQRKSLLEKRLHEFAVQKKVKNIQSYVDIVTTSGCTSSLKKCMTVFNVADRTYVKCRSDLETQLMRFLLPDAKFIPLNED